MDAVLTVGLENYLDVLGIPLIQGRGFERGDTPEAVPVAVVSASLARRAWPGERAVGKHFRTFDDSLASIEVVGVAADVRHEGLAAEAASTVYLPLTQSSRETHEVVLRVRGDIASAIQSARGTVANVSPTTPIRRVVVLDETIAASVAVPRFRTALVMGLDGLASVLALLGVYGGRAGAFLFEITPTDPVTYLAVVVGVLVVCCIAAYVPARRAATIDPVAVRKAD
jgi:hypothetical protein